MCDLWINITVMLGQNHCFLGISQYSGPVPSGKYASCLAPNPATTSGRLPSDHLKFLPLGHPTFVTGTNERNTWYPFNNCIYHMSRPMGKPTICIGENKGADQLRGNREADQRLSFRYSDSTIPPLLNSKISCF